MKGYYNGTMFEGFMSFLGLKRNWNEDADSLRLEYSGDYSLLNLVHTHEATVASSESLRPVIGTVGLGFCVAMAGYDSSQKVGFLSHNCPGDYVEVFHDLILEELQKKLLSDLEMDIYIVGGMIYSGELVSRLRNYAENNLNPKSINEDLALNVSDWTYLGKSFLLDVRDGNTYSIDGGGRL